MRQYKQRCIYIAHTVFDAASFLQILVCLLKWYETEIAQKHVMNVTLIWKNEWQEHRENTQKRERKPQVTYSVRANRIVSASSAWYWWAKLKWNIYMICFHVLFLCLLPSILLFFMFPYVFFIQFLGPIFLSPDSTFSFLYLFPSFHFSLTSRLLWPSSSLFLLFNFKAIFIFTTELLVYIILYGHA
jgi:uncharacterized membrane protein